MKLTKIIAESKQATAEAACKACLFYVASSTMNGACHRAPPSSYGWPTVQAVDWCGEFDPQAGWQ